MRGVNDLGPIIHWRHLFIRTKDETNEIYNTCENAANPPVKIFLSAGSIYDAKEGADKMKGILDSNMCTYQFVEVNESHSWGQWRTLLDDILVYFFPVSN